MRVKIPTNKRCNEMIRYFENRISENLGVKTEYKGKQRKLLINMIKDNPTHFWQVTDKGLIHYGI